MSAFRSKATSGGGDFTTAPAGSHPAVLVALVDLGTHEDSFNGRVSKNRKVFLAWELTGEVNPDTGEKFLVGRDYTNSLNERAAFRKLVEAWSGRKLAEGEEFDYTKLLGKACLINLVHQESKQSKNTYAKIDSVTQLPKGMKVEPASRKPFTWEMGQPLDLLPDWLPRVYGTPAGDVIRASEEGRSYDEGGSDGAGSAAVNNDDLAEIF